MGSIFLIFFFDWNTFPRVRINVFPERRGQSDAIRWCEKLKGKMALPKDAEENARLYHISEPFAGVCQPPNHAKGFLWIAATDEGEEGHWTDFEASIFLFVFLFKLFWFFFLLIYFFKCGFVSAVIIIVMVIVIMIFTDSDDSDDSDSDSAWQ